MGNKPAIITNSTPYSMKVKIHQNEKRFKEITEGSTLSVDAKVKTLIADSSFGIGYKKNTDSKGHVEYVDSDFHGFFTISADTTQNVTDRVHQTDSNFLSIFIIYTNKVGKKVIHIIQEDCEYFGPFMQIVGFKEPKDEKTSFKFDPLEIEIAQIAQEDHPWRSKGGSQNYYYNRKCEDCGGKIDCKPSCNLNRTLKGRTESS